MFPLLIMHSNAEGTLVNLKNFFKKVNLISRSKITSINMKINTMKYLLQ